MPTKAPSNNYQHFGWGRALTSHCIIWGKIQNPVAAPCFWRGWEWSVLLPPTLPLCLLAIDEPTPAQSSALAAPGALALGWHPNQAERSSEMPAGHCSSPGAVCHRDSSEPEHPRGGTGEPSDPWKARAASPRAPSRAAGKATAFLETYNVLSL